METASERFFVHVTLEGDVGHVVQVLPDALRAGDVDRGLAGYRFDSPDGPQVFLTWTIEVDHSDADGILMAAEMQGKTDVWLEIDRPQYDAILEIRDPVACGCGERLALDLHNRRSLADTLLSVLQTSAPRQLTGDDCRPPTA